MARQDVSNTEQQARSSEQRESSQGREVTRGQQQGAVARRNAFYDPFNLSLTPFDLLRMHPFSLMRRMTEELDRAVDTWVPAVEVFERDNNFVVRAELPGLKPEDVKIEVNNDTLIIEGERKLEKEEGRGGVHRTERRYGAFYRAIALPDGTNPEQAQARFDNGVLEITVPVSQQQQNKSRQIPIQGSSQGTANEGQATQAGTSQSKS